MVMLHYRARPLGARATILANNAIGGIRLTSLGLASPDRLMRPSLLPGGMETRATSDQGWIGAVAQKYTLTVAS